MTHITRNAAKAQARALRQSLAATGHTISHSASLELVAKQMGHRDWNTLNAALGNQDPPPWTVGGRVTGTYLGHRFSGEVIGLRDIASGAKYAVTIRFDTAIDVVPFNGFSNFRRQVNATVNREGVTVERTSDGVPHMVLET